MSRKQRLSERYSAGSTCGDSKGGCRPVLVLWRRTISLNAWPSARLGPNVQNTAVAVWPEGQPAAWRAVLCSRELLELQAPSG